MRCALAGLVSARNSGLAQKPVTAPTGHTPVESSQHAVPPALMCANAPWASPIPYVTAPADDGMARATTATSNALPSMRCIRHP